MNKKGGSLKMYIGLNYPKVKGQLVEKEKTIEDLATFIGISRTNLNLKLLGKKRVTLDEFIKILNYFECNDSNFFLKTDDNN